MKNKKLEVLFLIVGIVLFLILGVMVYKDFFATNKSKKLATIGLYGYTLHDTDTKLYKSEFEALETILDTKPINYEEYAKSIAKLFVIDVYTLNNKMASTDIGGTEFLHKDLKENFKENMGASIYKFIESNIDGKRNQELPEVSEVTVSKIFETTYKYDSNQYPAYEVSLTWKYDKELGYQTSTKITIINSNDVLYIVKGE